MTSSTLSRPRFSKTLREHARRDGTTDRYWVVEDLKHKRFKVLKVNASYTGAELLAGAYALKLNVKWEKGDGV